jgi:hypothetical protein
MKPKMSRLAVLFTAVALTAGCAYVKETEEGRSVRVVPPAEAQTCTHLGKVRVSVAKMGRGAQFVREDLIRLARNNAAKSGADTVVAVGEPENSEQTFEMFRCIKP